jgi:hypothetical protein
MSGIRKCCSVVCFGSSCARISETAMWLQTPDPPPASQLTDNTSNCYPRVYKHSARTVTSVLPLWIRVLFQSCILLPSSEYRFIVQQLHWGRVTDVSQAYAAPIFRAEEQGVQEAGSCLLPDSCLAYSSALKTEVTFSSEALTHFERSSLRCRQEHVLPARHVRIHEA